MNNWLVVGLGNPGREYQFNRHNIGFMAIDMLAEHYGMGAAKRAFQSIAQPALIDDTPVILLKPQTYMNLSGGAIGAAARFFKIPVEKVIVMHDELEIAPGTIRVKKGGGHAGHNGLKSIDQHFGNPYWRVRLGIGRPEDKSLITPHVLGNFTASEMEWVSPLLEQVTKHFPLLFYGKPAEFTNKIVHVLPLNKE